jgi:uncharacterized BrkB/YihY/UPF0761 family membrane protein
MAYLDAQTGSLIVLLIGLIFLAAMVGWILNTVAAVFAWKIGRSARTRFILHVIGFFLYPLGSVMGFIWLFKWRENAKMKDE